MEILFVGCDLTSAHYLETKFELFLTIDPWKK